VRRGFLYHGEKIKLLSGLHPLAEGTDTTSGNHDAHWATRCWVNHGLWLEVWHLAALRFHVGVADIVASHRALASNFADFCHKILVIKTATLYMRREFSSTRLTPFAILMNDMNGGKGEAYVVAVSMGYGHERAANGMRSFAVGRKAILANDYEGIPQSDLKMWSTSRSFYERISRFKSFPVLGEWAFGVMDWIQAIPAFYPRRDLSEPTIQLKEVYGLIRKAHWCKHLVDELGKDPKPLVCTFMTPAFAAEEFNYPGDIYIVLCDADVARAWVPLDPKKSRIKFFAPTGRVAERLKLYGVKEENIFLTGFPLPMDAVGGPEAGQIYHDLSRRVCHLDPKNIFLSQSEAILDAKMGRGFCKTIEQTNARAVSLTFAIGGAGAQREMAAEAMHSLSPSIKAGKLKMTLVAGIRNEVAEYFLQKAIDAGLQGALEDGGLVILQNKDRHDYFTAFNKLMMETDILWTKPSELSFYAGLGIPILMAPTVGSQENFNRDWLFQVGAGADALDPKYADEWLWDWINGGALARMAWNGFVNAPTHGAYRIEDVVRGRPVSMHALPLVV
jgi:hypothetical protein